MNSVVSMTGFVMKKISSCYPPLLYHLVYVQTVIIFVSKNNSSIHCEINILNSVADAAVDCQNQGLPLIGSPDSRDHVGACSSVECRMQKAKKMMKIKHARENKAPSI